MVNADERDAGPHNLLVDGITCFFSYQNIYLIGFDISKKE